MGAIWFPELDKALLEPNLLLPGVKPLRARLDRRCKSYVLANELPPRNIVNNSAFTSFNSADANYLIKPTNRGLAIGEDTSTTAYWRNNEFTWDDFNDRAFSLIVRATINTSTSVTAGVLSFGGNSRLHLYQYTSQVRCLIQGSDRLTDTYSQGDSVFFAVTKSAGTSYTFTMYINDVSDTWSFSNEGSSAVGLTIGEPINNRGLNGELDYVLFIEDEELSASEINTFKTDGYYIFEPAGLISLPVAAAGATGKSNPLSGPLGGPLSGPIG